MNHHKKEYSEYSDFYDSPCSAAVGENLFPMVVSCEPQSSVGGLGKSVLSSAPASQSCMGLVLEGLDLLEDSLRRLAARRLAEATEITLLAIQI